MRKRYASIASPVLVLMFFILLPLASWAQYHEHDDDETTTLDTANLFCVKLSSVMKMADDEFDEAKDSLIDSSGQKTWDVKEKYKLNGSRDCKIFQNGNKITYVAFYLSRNGKDALAPSYNNLYHQLKDCLGYTYVYHDQKTTAAEKLMGITNYGCEMAPFGDGTKLQADMHISIVKMPSGNYELILEVKKYTGYYINR